MKKEAREQLEAFREFVVKTDLTATIMTATRYLDPKLSTNEEILQKALFNVVNATDVETLQSLADSLIEEAEKKAEECNQLSKIVGSLDLEGDE